MLNSQFRRSIFSLLLFVLCHFCGGHSFLLAQTSVEDSLQTSSNAGAIESLKKTPRGAVIRSAIFPGWGQWYNGKKFKALFVFGVEVGFISAAVWHNQRVVYWMDSSKTNYAVDYRDLNKNFHIDMRNQFVWYLAGALLVSMADAYVDAHLADFDESTDLAFAPYTITEGRLSMGFRLSLTKSF